PWCGRAMCSCLWAAAGSAGSALVWAASSLVRPPIHLVLVGLDSSGKTTALMRLKYGQYVNAVPTVGFNCERIRGVAGSNWVLWDVGGAEKIRPLWRSYTRATDALVFVLDSCSSPERLEEARLELARLSKQQGSECATMSRPRPPLLLLANKQDLPAAKDPLELAKALGLQELPESQLWAVAGACAITGEGLDEAMITLKGLVVKSRQNKPSGKLF
ncbi:unnamed protein product, partial [Meganyctiphanes norvegica]